MEEYILYFTDLNTDLCNLITNWNISNLYIFHRKITKHTTCILYKMCMCLIITFIICLAIDSWKTSQYSFFRHWFNISIYSSSPYFWLSRSDFIKNIISGKMTTGTGITYDITVLMGAHSGIMRKSLEKATFLVFYFVKHFSPYASRKALCSSLNFSFQSSGFP